jgi:hypothetical protein
VDFDYARFNWLSIDRQCNYASDVRCGPTINAKMPRRTIFGGQQNVVFDALSPNQQHASSVTKLPNTEVTPNDSRVFHHLGMATIDFARADFVREVIQFFRNAAQHLLHVRLDGHVRQSPRVVSFCVIVVG